MMYLYFSSNEGDGLFGGSLILAVLIHFIDCVCQKSSDLIMAPVTDFSVSIGIWVFGFGILATLPFFRTRHLDLAGIKLILAYD